MWLDKYVDMDKEWVRKLPREFTEMIEYSMRIVIDEHRDFFSYVIDPYSDKKQGKQCYEYMELFDNNGFRMSPQPDGGLHVHFDVVRAQQLIKWEKYHAF